MLRKECLFTPADGRYLQSLITLPFKFSIYKLMQRRYSLSGSRGRSPELAMPRMNHSWQALADP